MAQDQGHGVLGFLFCPLAVGTNYSMCQHDYGGTVHACRSYRWPAALDMQQASPFAGNTAKRCHYE